MKKVSALFLLAFAFGFFFSCKHEPILPPNEVSYRNDILPIVRGSCQHSGCHDPNDPNAEFPLDSIVSQVLEYVDPGKPKDSKIYERITSTNSEERMPRPPYEALTARQINLIYIWIGQGAKDN